jgi:hypothetical protein
VPQRSSDGQSSLEVNREVIEDTLPVNGRTLPLLLYVSKGEVEKLDRGFVVREVALRLDDLS